jgi:hypothetical protein
VTFSYLPCVSKSLEYIIQQQWLSIKDSRAIKLKFTFCLTRFCLRNLLLKLEQCNHKAPQLFYFSLLSTAASTAPNNQHWNVGQSVKTQSGIVHGHSASIATQVSAYFGIPYALPPSMTCDLLLRKSMKAISPLMLPNLYVFPTPCHHFADLTGFQEPSCPISTVWRTGAPANFTDKHFTTAGHDVLELLLQTGNVFSENCLTLNIWTKPQLGER